MKCVVGGFGDFLQVVKSAIKERKIEVYTHQNKEAVKSFFNRIGVDAKVFDLEDYSKANCESLKRDFYYDLEKYIDRKYYPEGIGIHAFGSQFADKFALEHGLLPKSMSYIFLKELIEYIHELNPDEVIYLFGSPNEKDKLIEFEKYNVRIVCEENFWDSLSYLLACKYLIAVDSSIKTASGILNIPTLVLMRDYKDLVRDTYFIKPYNFKLNNFQIDEVKKCIQSIIK